MENQHNMSEEEGCRGLMLRPGGYSGCAMFSLKIDFKLEYNIHIEMCTNHNVY